ncbi:hypothetical protein LEP1GSC005_4048 [Leptospira santarosai str. ST188]|nr:hypothetical protein LEP1GSC005_4048 [Leptospira santarosai str. ST188]
MCKIYFTNAVLGMLDLFTKKVLKYETPVAPLVISWERTTT